MTNTSTAVWSDGMSGEFTDYFATQCEHVYVTITPMDQKGANAVDTPGLTTSLADSAAIDAGDPTMFDTLNVYGYLDSLTRPSRSFSRSASATRTATRPTTWRSTTGTTARSSTGPSSRTRTSCRARRTRSSS